jgi:hypothetical protein
MTDKPGATGRFPHGRMGPHDHGEIAVGLRIEFLHGDPLIVIDFGRKSISWFSMRPDEADQFADTLKARAAMARRLKPQ